MTPNQLRVADTTCKPRARDNREKARGNEGQREYHKNRPLARSKARARDNRDNARDNEGQRECRKNRPRARSKPKDRDNRDKIRDNELFNLRLVPPKSTASATQSLNNAARTP